MLADRVYR